VSQLRLEELASRPPNSQLNCLVYEYLFSLHLERVAGAVEEEEAIDRCFRGRGAFVHVHFLASWLLPPPPPRPGRLFEFRCGLAELL